MSAAALAQPSVAEMIALQTAVDCLHVRLQRARALPDASARRAALAEAMQGAQAADLPGELVHRVCRAVCPAGGGR